jgi:hypothetical protein
MKTIVALLIILNQLVPGASHSESNVPRTESAKSETRDVKITVSVSGTEPLELVRPSYPGTLHVSGRAVVWVRIDKSGRVVAARGISGHPLLKSLAIDAARESKFKRSSALRTKYIIGTITYVVTSAEIPYSELSSLIGQQVTLHGEFSMEGKVGPFVRVSGNPVYLIARGMFAWGRRYERMEGKVVSVTGTLRFFKAPPAPKPAGSIPVAWVSDHFYFERGNSTIQLDNQ